MSYDSHRNNGSLSLANNTVESLRRGYGTGSVSHDSTSADGDSIANSVTTDYQV